ncbi:MAG: tRNA(Ile)-lysidine synthetase, partial [Bradyrhizobium sp.]|nr:tRNA(Ile)-lysidine synthetase [Bradyrhizobium sp.]
LRDGAARHAPFAAGWSGAGSFDVDARVFAGMPEEIRLRLLKRAIDRLGHEGPAELGKVETLLAVLDRAVAEWAGRRRPGLIPSGQKRQGLKQTLGGALVSLTGGRIRVEPAPPRRRRAD